MNTKKALPTYFFLIFIPAVFGIFLYFCILNIEKRHAIESIKINLSERAVDFMAQANAVDYFQYYFNQLSNIIFPYLEKPTAINNNLSSIEAISNSIAVFSQNINENIRCAVFNENFEIINQSDLKDFEIRFFTFAWKKLHKQSDADYEGRRTDQDEILGRDFDLNPILEYDEKCIQTSKFGKTGVFYFKNANKKNKGLIAFTEYKRTNLELALSKAKEYYTSEQPVILFYEKDGKFTSSYTSSNLPISHQEIITDKFLNGFEKENMIWRGFKSDDYKLLLGQKVTDYEKYKTKGILGVLAFLLFLSFASLLFFKSISKYEGIRISIRYKLIAIFVLAIYMPTFSLWILSKTSLHDQRTAIENSIIKGMQAITNNIDQNFKTCLEEAHEAFSQLDAYLKSFSGKPLPTFTEIEDKTIEITRKFNKTQSQIFNWLDIRTIDQKQIYTTSNQESNKRLERIGRVISILCLERYCPSRLTKAGVKPTQSDIIVGNILENPMAAFSSVFERPREFTPQAFEGTYVYWWFNYIEDENNQIAFFIGDSAMRFMAPAYLQNLLTRRYTLENTNLKLVSFSKNSQVFLPEEAKNYPDLMKLINVSNNNKTIESSVVNYDNNQYLCLCYPGNIMKDYSILCMYPTSEIDYKIDKVRKTIYTVMVLLLIISILTGLLLSKTFIIPVKELERGLQALRKRETDTTIKIENKDELGNLGNAFNLMMADIKDMLMASAIQQCLIPTGKHEIDGYECLVYNEMATDVGGDYADIFELPNDRLLVVIGDVTGHGVSSALLTGMVKASVFRFAQKDTPLSEIATNTSNMIFDLLDKKKLMTFCALTLDKKSGEIAFCNAGHPYPMIHSKKGVLRAPSQNGLPLGVSKRRCRYKAESEKLDEGETLILYTDGFPEAENANKEEFTYERFQEMITNEEINSVEELEDHLIEAFQEHHGNAELADDVTFIIIKRLKTVASN